jgi:D-lactate dehydrogenase
MKIAIFSAHCFEISFLREANKNLQYELTFFDCRLTAETVEKARGFTVVSCFITDQLDAGILKILANNGTQLIALRSAGFNHVDLAAAKKENLIVTRVPRYSPYAVAEFAVGLILSLNRKIPQANNQIQKHNFSLDNLLGFDLHGKTVGVIGAGAIGSVFAKIMRGFGCHVLAYDIVTNPACEKLGIYYVTLDELYQQSDIISLHCPLIPETYHIINEQALEKMKRGIMLINTGRGALIDTQAAIDALGNGKIGYLGLDVYEYENKLFFQDLSSSIIADEMFLRLQDFPNILITGHQAFLTQEALTNIAETLLATIASFSSNKPVLNQLT